MDQHSGHAQYSGTDSCSRLGSSARDLNVCARLARRAGSGQRSLGSGGLQCRSALYAYLRRDRPDCRLAVVAVVSFTATHQFINEKRRTRMKLRIFCLLALACFAISAFAQAAKPAATPNAQAKKTAPPTIASAVDQQISIVEREFVSAAEAMPDDKFNFAPGSLNIANSEYKGVKTFA